MQHYRNVTHLLVRRKADIMDASQTGNTRKDDSNTQKQPHQLQNKNPTYVQSFYYSYLETTQITRNSKAYTSHSQQ